MPESDRLILKCGTHGERVPTVVCCHLLQVRDEVLGFVENSAQPDDLQAWCMRCEAMFLAEDGLTEAFKRFNDFKIVCDFCYADIRSRHSLPAR